jgi:IAA-amino acid hydrolase
MEEKLRHYPAVVNDQGMDAHAKTVAESLLGKENVKIVLQLIGGVGFRILCAEKGGIHLRHIGVGSESTMVTVHTTHSS